MLSLMERDAFWTFQTQQEPTERVWLPPPPRTCTKRASGSWDTWRVPDQVPAECGLGMEPCLELLMLLRSRTSLPVVARPAEDVSLRTSPDLAQRTKAWGLSGWTPFLSQPSIPLSIGSWGKGPGLAHTREGLPNVLVATKSL